MKVPLLEDSNGSPRVVLVSGVTGDQCPMSCFSRSANISTESWEYFCQKAAARGTIITHLPVVCKTYLFEEHLNKLFKNEKIKKILQLAKYVKRDTNP